MHLKYIKICTLKPKTYGGLFDFQPHKSPSMARFCEIYEQLRLGHVYDPLKRKAMGDFKTSFFAIITQCDQNIGL